MDTFMLFIILSMIIFFGGVSAFTFYIVTKYGNPDNKHEHRTHAYSGNVNESFATNTY
jgi:heme/copper-type cytochrome/quinol oxidase subunit 2